MRTTDPLSCVGTAVAHSTVSHGNFSHGTLPRKFGTVQNRFYSCERSQHGVLECSSAKGVEVASQYEG